MYKLSIKRIYDIPSKSDGYRILVDRLWPRGVSKEVAQLDEWDKDVAPSSDLRIWFGHKPERFEEFAIKYREELSHNKEELLRIKHLLKLHNVTLLYAAKNPQVNHAIVLKDYINHLK